MYRNRAQVLSTDFEVDVEKLASEISAVSGKIVIAMHPAPKELAPGILGLEENSKQIRPDTGTVIATPAERPIYPKLGYEYGYPLPYPKIGDVVLIHPSDGSRVAFGKHELCVVGAYLGEQEWEPGPIDWFDSILARVDEEAKLLRAFGDKIVIQIDAKADKSTGGILIPDVAQKWQADAVVLSVGDLVDDLIPGDIVSVDMNLVTNAGIEFVMGKEYERQFVIPQLAVNWKYIPKEA